VSVRSDLAPGWSCLLARISAASIGRPSSPRTIPCIETGVDRRTTRPRSIRPSSTRTSTGSQGAKRFDPSSSGPWTTI
jgi:hypothetical protein